jgi:membrane protein implicated in regulation of membrane protease activity
VAFLILALVLAMIVAIAILALGLFIVVTPVVLVAGVAYYLFRKIVPRSAPRQSATGMEIIEGEFRVVDPDAPAISAPSRDRMDRP